MTDADQQGATWRVEHFKSSSFSYGEREMWEVQDAEGLVVAMCFRKQDANAIVALERDKKRLEKALQRYGQHEYDCWLCHKPEDLGATCTCGLRAAEENA